MLQKAGRSPRALLRPLRRLRVSGNNGAISQDSPYIWGIRSPSPAVQSHELFFWDIIFIFHLLLPWLLGEAQAQPGPTYPEPRDPQSSLCPCLGGVLGRWLETPLHPLAGNREAKNGVKKLPLHSLPCAGPWHHPKQRQLSSRACAACTEPRSVPVALYS